MLIANPDTKRMGCAKNRLPRKYARPTTPIPAKAELNLPGIAAVLELRGKMDYLDRPAPPAEEYLDLSYYRKAIGSD